MNKNNLTKEESNTASIIFEECIKELGNNSHKGNFIEYVNNNSKGIILNELLHHINKLDQNDNETLYDIINCCMFLILKNKINE